MTQPYSGESPFRRVRRVVIGTAPAAGADWSLTVPAGVIWHVMAIKATLATAVAVANRSAALSVSDGSTPFVLTSPAAVQVASLVRQYNWWHDAVALAVGVTVTQAIPELYIPSGYVIASSTDSIAGADQWSAPVLWVVETTVRDGSVELAESPDMVVEIFSGPGA